MSQKVAQKLLTSCLKKQTFFGLMLKCNTTKVRFLSIFVQFCGVTIIANLNNFVLNYMFNPKV